MLITGASSGIGAQTARAADPVVISEEILRHLAYWDGVSMWYVLMAPPRVTLV